MPLPPTIRVKIIPDDAGSISIAPVRVKKMTPAELIEVIVTQTGKDALRVRRLFSGGTLVSGSSRLRWEKLPVEDDEMTRLLAGVPDPEPNRAFEPDHCEWAVFQATGRRPIEVTRQAGKKRRLLRRRCFWDLMLAALKEKPAEYVDYSYREKADCYRINLSPPTATEIRDAANMLAYNELMRRLRDEALVSVKLYTPRGSKTDS